MNQIIIVLLHLHSIAYINVNETFPTSCCIVAKFSSFTISLQIAFFLICLFHTNCSNNKQWLFTSGSLFLFWYRQMWEFVFSQGLNSILAGCLPLLYLDYKVFNLHQLVSTQHVVALDVVAEGQDGAHLGDLRWEITFAHLTGAQITM